MMQPTGQRVLLLMLSTGLKMLAKTSENISTMLMIGSCKQVRISMIGQKRLESLSFSIILTICLWILLSQELNGPRTLVLLMPLKMLANGLPLRLTKLAMSLKKFGKMSQNG